MRKLLLLTVLLSVLVSCGGRKQIEKQLHSGNYDVAIAKALKKLETNKDKKRKRQFVVMLEDAYRKVVARDLKTIEHLKKDGNPEQFRSIYEIYANLDARQEAIKPFLPLKIGNKIVNLNFRDYSNELVDYRYKVSDYLIDQGLGLLDTGNKYQAREAFVIFEYIDTINPNFEDVRSLLEEAHQKGTDHVIVSIENDTHQIIPARLEDELLNFNTYGLNDFWTVYHTTDGLGKKFDFAMQLQLKRINISSDQWRERQILREKQIVDGWEYVLDQNGNVAQDSLGNDLKVDKIINVRARIFEVEQFKSAQVIAKVIFTDLRSNNILDAFPIDTEFVFQNKFGRLRGDERALNDNDLQLIRNKRLPFPTNSEMVYDSGEDLKHQLKHILNSHPFKG
ncbi:MAG: hypothetical protein HKO80_01240 [Flavobacteriaceae bacterium]|nr:hypothetical protein [Flavobacteriaceae bacterium]